VIDFTRAVPPTLGGNTANIGRDYRQKLLAKLAELMHCPGVNAAKNRVLKCRKTAKKSSKNQSQ
jgi:hypothetical protein